MRNETSAANTTPEKRRVWVGGAESGEKHSDGLTDNLTCGGFVLIVISKQILWFTGEAEAWEKCSCCVGNDIGN